MFLKPFKVKSQTAIKGSDRKKLRADLGRRFPNASPEQLIDLVPNKEELTVMKIYTHSGVSVTVYNLQRNPSFFELDRLIYPTVYSLWKCPQLMPVFTTWPPVLNKLLCGADLMLPGLVVQHPVTPTSLGNHHKGQACAVKLLGNKCPVGVGKTALSSSDMCDAGLRGKGIVMLHCYQDLLWAHGEKTDPPLIDDTDLLQAAANDYENGSSNRNGEGNETGEADGHSLAAHGAFADNRAELASASVAPSSVCVRTQDAETGERECHKRTRNELPTANPVHQSSNCATAEGFEKLTLDERSQELEGAVGGALGGVMEEQEEEEDPSIRQGRMDELLYTCFLHALKVHVKKNDLPLLTSKFAKVHMQPCCPPSQTLDVKKSSYKKLSKFLMSMQMQGIIKVKELSSGVESITEVARDHPALREFVVPAVQLLAEDRERKPAPSTEQYHPPEITEMFLVTSATLPIFKLAKYQKSRALLAADVRRVLTDYVKENQLQSTQNQGFVTLDPILSDVVLNKGEYIETLTWEELFTRCQSKMSLAQRVTFPGQAPQIKKGKLESIVLSVVQRSGNKKVTMVQNVETYGVDPHEFARYMQVKAAVSCSVMPQPGKGRGEVVHVQGNQIRLVAEALTEKYGLPKKYIDGLENAPKGKRR